MKLTDTMMEEEKRRYLTLLCGETGETEKMKRPTAQRERHRETARRPAMRVRADVPGFCKTSPTMRGPSSCSMAGSACTNKQRTQRIQTLSTHALSYTVPHLYARGRCVVQGAATLRTMGALPAKRSHPLRAPGISACTRPRSSRQWAADTPYHCGTQGIDTGT